VYLRHKYIDITVEMAYRALNTGEKVIALSVGAGAVGLWLNRQLIPYVSPIIKMFIPTVKFEGYCNNLATFHSNDQNFYFRFNQRFSFT